MLIAFFEDRALLCPGFAGTDRFWPKRRAKPRVRNAARARKPASRAVF